MKQQFPFSRPIISAPALLVVIAAVLTGCAGEPPAVVSIPGYVPPPPARVEIEPHLPEVGPLPTLEEDPPPAETVFDIDPAEGYRFDDGYVKIAYFDDSREIVVEIGNVEVDGANTKWYAHEIFLDGKKYRKNGGNTIPFVRGKDGLWWNEERLKLPAAMNNELMLNIIDEYRNKTHTFTVRKKVIRR